MGELREGEADMTDYEALEREHFGDPDKGTGIYAPKVINDRCSHGVSWNDDCPACKLADAQRVVRQWGSTVDEARKTIAEVTLPDSEGGEI